MRRQETLSRKDSNAQFMMKPVEKVMTEARYELLSHMPELVGVGVRIKQVEKAAEKAAERAKLMFEQNEKSNELLRTEQVPGGVFVGGPENLDIIVV